VNRHGEFAKARARAELTEQALRESAARTVATQAIDAEDLHGLLAMLGLDGSESRVQPHTDLAGFRLRDQ
jgi:hypothetical protein